MSVLYRRSTRAFLLVAAVLLSLLFATLTPAHAGTIGCGNQQFGFFNRTVPSSQIHIYHPALCAPYSDILTIYGDTVWLDWSGGGYMILSPRTACDYSTFSNGYKYTMRNPTYNTTYYQWPEDYDRYSFTVWKCVNY